MLIPAFQKDDALVADVAQFRHLTTGFRVWWLGQSGFLVQWQGRHLLLDPYLSDSLTRKYADTDKPHTRLSERVVDAARLTMVDVVTSSHNHTDHLDPETLQPLRAANPGLRILAPEANRATVAERAKCLPAFPVGINDDGQAIEIAGFTFLAVPAAHNQIERDEQGHCKFIGLVVKFGPYALYHSGDTLWYPGLEDLLRSHRVDVAFLPINGNRPERRVAGNLDFDEAARLGRAMGAKLTVPHHYHLFEFNTEDPAKFAQAAQQHGTPYRVLRLGERLDVA
ncbi:MAG: MBL fold metallo-hydrolase [Bernardetiaceae bacterium]|jgi:L-ascorbate metabolism protein UlaG (beta-lactamase superfamily)|nr:MBL fold metallo-hydrolase [Bernardetiaceae bacterium]